MGIAAFMSQNVPLGKGLHRIMLDGSGPGVNSWCSTDILYPPIPRIEGLTMELSGLLPNRDHNADLFAALASHRVVQEDPSGGPLVALFLADPFLRVPDVVRVLRRSGLRRVVNLPSVAQYDAHYAQILDGLGIGPEHEFNALSLLAEQGLRVSVAVAHVHHVDRALSLQPEKLLLVPRFDHCHNEKQQVDDLAELAEAARQRKESATELFVPL